MDDRSAADRFEHLSSVLDAARERVCDDIDSAAELLDTASAIVGQIDQQLAARGLSADARTRAAADRVRTSHAALLQTLQDSARALHAERAELDAVADAISRYASRGPRSAQVLDRLC